MEKLRLITELIVQLSLLHGSPEVLEEQKSYASFRMADGCKVEVWQYAGDSTLVVETVCAPICSSCARIYSKESELMREVPSPLPHAVFPFAHIEDGKLVWEDNTDIILDEEELQRQPRTDASD